MTESHSIFFGKTEICYSLSFSERKTLAIHVYPEGNVIVNAPIDASFELIAEKIKKRAAWIIKQQQQFASYPPTLPKRHYVSGETYRYLGRQYRLSIQESAINQVKLSHGRLCIETTQLNNPVEIKKLLDAWYRNSATIIFAERYNFCLTQLIKLGITHHQGFQLRLMPKRWGSCTKQGHVILNPELITAPKVCIDYVITHELCHLKEHNHSPAFYQLLTLAMNDWKQRRKQLNEMIETRFV
ncbi:hypothetical protein DOJK_00528 [Patescibacteria group bacterium]|nr:hypothetical protein DOJK_00528 [Patescibacteria group bacterium]